MTTRGISNKVFERRIPARPDSARMIASFIIDVSGSMKDEWVQTLLESAYAMSRALETNKDSAQVMQYDHNVYVAKQYNKTTKEGIWSRFDNGGNNEFPVFTQVHKDMMQRGAAVKARVKVVFIFTDGCWESDPRIRGALDAMRADGVKVVLVMPKGWEKQMPSTRVTGIEKNDTFFVGRCDDMLDVIRGTMTQLQRNVVARVTGC
jgi:predicted metal-dependent peptidase